MNIELEKCEYLCGNCGKKFHDYQLYGEKYGEFLLRSSGVGSLRYLNTFKDEIFDEVFSLIKRGNLIKSDNEFKISEIFHAVFGVACDSDVDGTLFRINRQPKCSHCGASEIADWHVLPSDSVVEKSIPHVTHAQWKRLSVFEQKGLVDKAVERYLSGEVF